MRFSLKARQSWPQSQRNRQDKRYLESSHDVLYLGILRVAKHLGNLAQTIPRLFARYNFLESPDAGSTLPFPVFGIRIKSFQHVKRL